MLFRFPRSQAGLGGNGKVIIAQILLLITATAWGTTFIVTKGVLDVIDPVKLLAYRFLIAVVVLCPVCARGSHQWQGHFSKGIILGIILSLAFIFQTYGLKYASVSMSAFLSGLYVVMVALIEFGVSRKRPVLSSVIGIVSASVGLVLLSWDGKLTLGLGDTLVLLGALFFALHVILTDRIVKSADPYVITIIQFATVSVISLIVMVLTHQPLALPRTTWLAMGYLGVIATAIAFLCQTLAQRYASSVHTAVILTAEPLVATAIVLITGFEAVTLRIMLGGALIVVGMLYSGKAEKSTDLSKAVPKNAVASRWD